MKFSSNTARLASLLVLMSLMSSIVGASIDLYDEDEVKSPTENDVKTGQEMSSTDDLNYPRQHKIPGMSKIIGGQLSVRGKTPWQGRIEIVDYNGYSQHHCGAVIISEYLLLTAAHCLKGFDISRMRIFVGDYRLSQFDAGEQMFTVGNHRIHEQYNLTSIHDNDIAVLKIRPTDAGRGIQFNRYVRPVQLPDSATYVSAGTLCLTSGWGLYNPEIKQSSEILKEGIMPILSPQTCQRYFDTPITQQMICAGDLIGTGACSGDSGGPLVCNINGESTVIGITSFVRRNPLCGAGRKPSVFASVPALRSWIRSNIQM